MTPLSPSAHVRTMPWCCAASVLSNRVRIWAPVVLRCFRSLKTVKAQSLVSLWCKMVTEKSKVLIEKVVVWCTPGSDRFNVFRVQPP